MVFEKVAQIIADQLGIDVEDIALETEFEEINADSLELVGVIMAVEQEFSIEVDDEDIEKVKTVGDVVDYINNCIQ